MKTQITTKSLSQILSMCALMAVVSAQGATSDPNPRAVAEKPTFKSALSHGDKSFVEDAAKAGMEEVAIAQIAVTKTSNPQVREFAQSLIADHGSTNTELTTLATDKGLMVSTKETSIDKWEKKSAKEFDADFLSKMISDHEKAVSLFEKESKSGEDPQLSAFAAKVLPTLQTHLSKARELHAMLK
jgi:putative membrane protein